MTDQKKPTRKVVMFAIGLIAVAGTALTIIWLLPGSMYGYGQGLSGLEAVSFYLSMGALLLLLALLWLITYVAYRIRRHRGAYGDFKLRPSTIFQFWLPMSWVLSLCGLVTALMIAMAGPRVLPLVIPQETYRKINHERDLIIEYAFRPEQAPWATQEFQDVVHRGDLKTIKRYLRYGADPKAKNHFGQTALHIAVLTGNEPLVRMFLDMGVDIEARDREGETPLHDASKKWNSEIMSILIDSGADVNAKSDYGTPLDVAKDHSNREAISQLEQAGAGSGE